jgi:hypothetical protein
VDEQRKKAYRYLLYHAMLDIRPSAWISTGVFRLLNPFYLRHLLKRVRRGGVIANWLHNLALFSVLDFESFDEQWFWGEFQSYDKRYPSFNLVAYKTLFDEELSGQCQIPSE